MPDAESPAKKKEMKDLNMFWHECDKYLRDGLLAFQNRPTNQALPTKRGYYWVIAIDAYGSGSNDIILSKFHLEFGCYGQFCDSRDEIIKNVYFWAFLDGSLTAEDINTKLNASAKDAVESHEKNRQSFVLTTASANRKLR